MRHWTDAQRETAWRIASGTGAAVLLAWASWAYGRPDALPGHVVALPRAVDLRLLVSA